MPYIVFLTAFIFSFISVPPLKSLAPNNGAVAHPGKRHIHTNPIPKLGGVTIAISVIIITHFVFPVDTVISAYLASSALILVAGIIDDLRAINWWIKLTISILATSIFIFGGGIRKGDGGQVLKYKKF